MQLSVGIWTADMSAMLKRLFFNTGATVHFLHLRSDYHGDLKLEDIWLYKVGDDIVPKLHGIKGLVTSTIITDLKERKKEDWHKFANMILEFFGRNNRTPCPKLRYYVDCLERERTGYSCLCHSYWWTFEEKKSRILQFHLMYEFKSAEVIELPPDLTKLLDDLSADSSEVIYAHDLSSVSSMLRNKLCHPVTPSRPLFKNKFENLLNHVESCWPEIWEVLDEHKKLARPSQPPSMCVPSGQRVGPSSQRVGPNKQEKKMLSTKQQMKQKKKS